MTEKDEQFIAKARKVHGDKYFYFKVDMEHRKEDGKICIICPKHGEFWQTPHNHLYGKGCKECRNEYLSKKFASTKEKFVEKARKIHGDKYDYSVTEYANNHTNVNIICPIHGVFEQLPSNHLQGHGCRFCQNYSMEDELEKELKKRNLSYLHNDRKILNGLELDFYLPQHNIAIECQGIQHFEPRDFSGHNPKMAEELFAKTLERDKRKKMLCEEKGIKLLYYSDLKRNFPYDVYTKISDLFEVLNIP